MVLCLWLVDDPKSRISLAVVPHTRHSGLVGQAVSLRELGATEDGTLMPLRGVQMWGLLGREFDQLLRRGTAWAERRLRRVETWLTRAALGQHRQLQVAPAWHLAAQW